jgi:hypothetical protein
MKRQAFAVLLGSLFALPALANNEITNYEIDAGSLPAAVATAKSRAQVSDELAAARHSGNWTVNSRLGTVSALATPAQFEGKSRQDVRAELAQSHAAGDYVVNAELGTTASQL